MENSPIANTACTPHAYTDHQNKNKTSGVANIQLLYNASNGLRIRHWLLEQCTHISHPCHTPAKQYRLLLDKQLAYAMQKQVVKYLWPVTPELPCHQPSAMCALKADEASNTRSIRFPPCWSVSRTTTTSTPHLKVERSLTSTILHTTPPYPTDAGSKQSNTQGPSSQGMKGTGKNSSHLPPPPCHPRHTLVIKLNAAAC